ncbi:MAG: UDP-N-acetylglucosamine 2-epimerase (non-hydrolyzing) [Proteobacteria bacterium]|nr:UDP-N-acetylglucosamine 2-epimerase (non-hydrolyzing) [Pseudomonadota bacterium]
MKVLTVVGARPQFVKAAVVSRQLAKVPDIVEVMVHTGQHFDVAMSASFFDELEMMSPAYNLEISGGGHGQMTGRMLESIEHVLSEEDPAIVVVYGDTNSTLAGALAAAKLGFPVAHIEAGLRSYRRDMPEEINRVLTDHLSQLLFCPTKQATTNLYQEGISAGVYETGDVMYDAALYASVRAEEGSLEFRNLNLEPNAYAIATVHRAENTNDGKRLARIISYLTMEAKTKPIVFPVHPRTRECARKFGLEFTGLLTIDPISYLNMAYLTKHACCVYTDSGGLQKEAYFHRTPCVTLRDETEWQNTVESGWNRLWTVKEYLPRREIDDFGDGNAAKVIVEKLIAGMAS